MKKLVTLLLALCLLMTLAAAEEYPPVETYKDLDKLDYNTCHDRLAELGLPVPVTYAEVQTWEAQKWFTESGKFLIVDYKQGVIFWEAGYDYHSICTAFNTDKGCLDYMEYSYQGDKYLYDLDFLYDNPSIVTLSVYDVETLEIVGNYDQDELPMEFPYPDWLPSYITAALE